MHNIRVHCKILVAYFNRRSKQASATVFTCPGSLPIDGVFDDIANFSFPILNEEYADLQLFDIPRLSSPFVKPPATIRKNSVTLHKTSLETAENDKGSSKSIVKAFCDSNGACSPNASTACDRLEYMIASPKLMCDIPSTDPLPASAKITSKMTDGRIKLLSLV
jgi:hypothetical protein